MQKTPVVRQSSRATRIPPPPPQSTVNSPNRSFYQLIQVSPENALQREAKGQTRGDRARFLQSFLTERTDPSDTHPLPSLSLQL